MNGRPLVSVIIPSFNSSRFVAQAVKSVLAQTYVPCEVIVVDDGSSDDTHAVLAPFYERIRYFYQSNTGLSKARNRGIEEAQGELIAFLDADDQWLPEKLIKQWKCLQADPNAALVHTDTYQLHDSDGRQTYVYRRKERFSGWCYPVCFWGNQLTVSSVMVVRRCLERIGVFDEEIRGPSTQDYDLWVRIARHYPFAYVNEPLVLYRHHDASGSLNTRMMLEDEYYVLAKTLNADPTLRQTQGYRRVQLRMFELAFQAGYSNIDAGDFVRARRYFQKALSYAPWNMKAWTFLASTFLPRPLRAQLRSLKRGGGRAVDVRMLNNSSYRSTGSYGQSTITTKTAGDDEAVSPRDTFARPQPDARRG
jgi:glycosyltransferase involved in cell wall biosynthesis